ncbi:unnamed protein product [Peniophora sp. CBMAI 1063]|nr:unnamed protein product [Peniophora sp. CBMAI 1063]
MLPVVYITLMVLEAPVFGRSVNAAPNLIATLMVSYKAWSHWKLVRVFSSQSGTSYSLAILLIVIESGLAYAGLTISYVIVLAFNNVATIWLTYIFTPLIAMYPALVIVLVATRRNLLERSIQAASTPSNMHRDIQHRPWVHDNADRKAAQCPACGHIGSNVPLRDRVSRPFSVDLESGIDLRGTISTLGSEDAQRSSLRAQIPSSSNPSNHVKKEGDACIVKAV